MKGNNMAKAKTTTKTTTTKEEEIAESLLNEEVKVDDKNSDEAMADETKKSDNKVKSLRELSLDTKRKALKTRKVTITYNDKRDNTEVNSAYLTCENQFFSITRIVPLDMPIELEECLINTAKEAKIPTHVPEYINNKSTGNYITKIIRKYSVVEEEARL